MIAFLTELRHRNELLYWFGWINFAGAVFCIIMTQLSNTQVLGINAYIKPLKFFLSIGIFTWSMGWYLFYLNEPGKVIWYSWMAVCVFAFEIIYITLRASQGQLSHFNISTTFNAAMFNAMGIAISVLTGWTAYIAYLFFSRSFPELPSAYVWAIRLGLIFFVLFAFQGGVMAARMAHTVGAPDGGPGLPLTNWSRLHGDLRIAHFLGMHALQLLPLTAFYLTKSIRAIVILSILYFIFTASIFIQAMMGRPLVK